MRNFIDEECENHKLVIDVGEITRNINQKKKPDTFLQTIDVHSVTNAAGEYIYSISM